MHYWLFGIVLVVSALVSSPGVAQEEPPEGCFCLADNVGQMQHACERKKFRNQFYWSAICRYAQPDGTIVSVPVVRITDEWAIIPSDNPDCDCELAARKTDGVIRAEDGDKE